MFERLIEGIEMKNRTYILITLSFAAIALFQSTPAAATTCTLETVTATYGFAAQGNYLRGNAHSGTGAARLIAIAGTYEFAEDGTVTRAFTINTGGEVADVVDTGTFVVNSDCRGEAVFDTPFGPEPIKLSIVGHGDAIMFMNALPGITLTGRMERQ
jgi:hypothetical protein